MFYYIAIFSIVMQVCFINEANSVILPPENQCIRHSSLKYKPEGPICQCKLGHCLVEKPEGLVCKKDYSKRYNGRRNRNCDRSYSINTTPILTTTTPMPVRMPILYSPTRSSYRRSGNWGEPVVTPKSIERLISNQGSFGFDISYDYSDEEYNQDYDYVSYVIDPIVQVTTPNSQIENFPITVSQRVPLRPVNVSPLLPRLNDSISIKQENCLKSDRIYWPYDDQCYTLLQQGPCLDDEWLSLIEGSNLSNNDITILCQKRPCPCRKTDPQLCEVQITKKVFDCGREREEKTCHVALAAEQDGICDEGEQIIVTPFGDGICGCRLNPPHMRWNGDGKCYPLLSHGSPCLENQSLQFSETDNQALCVATLCKPRFVLFEDGRCYILDTQGPCDEIEKLGINSKTYELECIPQVRSLQRSLWGLFPSVRGIPNI